MVNQASLRFIRFCIQYSSIAWLYYDYTLTWTREVRYIWTSEFRYTTIFYAGSRYGLIANVLYLLALANRVPNTNAAIIACKVLAVLARLSILSIWTIRTWAVWKRAVWVLVLLCPLGAMCVISDLIAITPLHSADLDEVIAIGTCTHELIATVLTTWKCLDALRGPEMTTLPGGGLYRQILDQGLLYFAGVSTLSVSAIVLHYNRPMTPEGKLAGRLLNAFVLPVSGFFTARFMLHMRALSDGKVTELGSGSFTSITFGSVSVSLPTARAPKRCEELEEDDSDWEDDDSEMSSVAGPSNVGDV